MIRIAIRSKPLFLAESVEEKTPEAVATAATAAALMLAAPDNNPSPPSSPTLKAFASN